MKTGLQLAFLIAISASAAGITWLVNDPNSKVVTAPHCDSKKIKPDEICFHDVPENVLWIDARSRDEWQKNGYPNSILWNLDAREDPMKMESDAALKISESTLVVIYCGSEACGTSRQIAEKARKLDLGAEVKTLYGGYPSLVFKEKR